HLHSREVGNHHVEAAGGTWQLLQQQDQRGVLVEALHSSLKVLSKASAVGPVTGPGIVPAPPRTLRAQVAKQTHGVCARHPARDVEDAKVDRLAVHSLSQSGPFQATGSESVLEKVPK